MYDHRFMYKMANDVAKIIWKMAKDDKSLDSLSLKDLFHKKIEMDADDLRMKLKDIVATQIKTEIQPFKSEITLSSSTKSITYIFGATAVSSRKQQTMVVPEQYVYRNVGSSGELLYEITNSDTQMLIDKAIIPLDLKWKLDYTNNVIVSWKHWVKT